MPKPRIGIVDADSLLYATALSAEMCARKQGADGEDLWFTVRSVGDCYTEVEAKVEALLEAIDADDGIMCLSSRTNFRYSVLPTYKSNRARTRRPPMMVHLRDAFMERKPFPVIMIDDLEADDVCGITSTAMQKGGRKEPVICSIDKDMNSIPGWLHQKGDTYEVTLEMADRAHLYQTLVGDVVDGYTGLPGIGPKKADAILDDADSPHPRDLWRSVLAAFIARGHTEEDALTQARVARILRVEDWDQVNKKVKLWTPQ